MFGRSTFSDFRDDPFFNFGNSGMNDHFREMERQFADMNQNFGRMPMFDPFEQWPAIEGGSRHQQDRDRDRRRGELVPSEREHPSHDRHSRELEPRHGGGLFGGFGLEGVFSGMNRMMENMHKDMESMRRRAESEDFDGQFYSSSSYQYYKKDGKDAEPETYQAQSSTTAGPGGVRETRRAVDDSRTGEKKMALGRHIAGRSHVLERRENRRTGDRSEDQHFTGLDEREAADFEREWLDRAGAVRDRVSVTEESTRRRRRENRQVMIADGKGRDI